MKKRVTCKCPNKIDACKKMLYIIIHDSRPVGVMTSAVDAAMLAKPLAGATVFSCHPNSTDVSECAVLPPAGRRLLRAGHVRGVRRSTTGDEGRGRAEHKRERGWVVKGGEGG